MDKRLCEICPYYEGNIVPLNRDNNISEQCSKKNCDSNEIEIEVNYKLNALVGEYKSF